MEKSMRIPALCHCTENPSALQYHKWRESQTMINMKEIQGECEQVSSRRINSLNKKVWVQVPRLIMWLPIPLLSVSFLSLFGLQGSSNGESSKFKETFLSKSKTPKHINVSAQLLHLWNTGYKCSILTSHRVTGITQRNWWRASYKRVPVHKC